MEATSDKTSSSGRPNVRTVQNIYVLTNPRSGDGFASHFLEKYPRENNCSIDAAVIRKKGAIEFVLVENLRGTEETVEIVTLDCTLFLFNVLEKEERSLCMQMLEQDLTGSQAQNRDRFLAIMGGDGSLATTLKMLRAKPAIETALKNRLISFVTLPFGTGCDAGQVFGWGNCPQDETWLDRIDSLTEEIVTGESDTLSVWKVTVDTKKIRERGDKSVYRVEDGVDVGIYNAFREPVMTNEFLMCCYFNIGFEPRVGALVERNRKKSRCLNKLNYCLFSFYEAVIKRERNQVKNYVDKVVSRPDSENEAVRADYSCVTSNPYNLVGCNIASCYGGQVTKDSWDSSARRQLRQSRQNRSADMWTSCDETSQTGVATYSDDKLELTCSEHWYSIILFRLSRFGQIRSPFRVELKDISEESKAEEDFEKNSVGLAVDGEIYLIQGGKHVSLMLDPGLPKIRMSRRRPIFKDINQIMTDLHHLSPPFV